ncbi:alpha-L-rhamnosidase [Leifsonia sp. TF02-11]|uniref:alpha-L-rhamnosidase n=1 Tax=Leifsonia sp. TF02-11 TaxID=2815212 RepID=UPI001AA0E98F|nr:alpha-L-rhamnosidase [Leifsonia sp. TF02-11]MBO1739490.1 family 78 glycoside hydrolase catalytic domain [Leifsonia sp. TF02-11]
MTSTFTDAAVSVDEIWLENRRGASTLGIAETRPRLSWLVSGDSRHTSFTVEGRASDGTVSVYDAEGAATSIAWPFSPLRSRERVTVRVRVSTADGHSAWSASQSVEAGLLERADWMEPFVSPSPSAAQGGLRPGYLLRNEWDLAAVGIGVDDIRHARVYSTAHGVYELELNGEPVSPDVLAPGWTSYRHRLRYQTTDITDRLRPGRNALGVWLADGWYRGRIGFDGGLWDYYGEDVSALVQLELTLTDGRLLRVPLADSWRYRAAPITAAGLYEGESYDARLLPRGWSAPGFDATSWAQPELLALDAFPAAIEAPVGPPIRVTDVLEPVAVERVASGRIRLDFGQNIAGKLRIRVRGQAGQTVRLHHAEVIENGELGVRPLRTAVSIDSYTLAGDRLEEWTPRFTLHGFRYAELEGWPGDIDTVDVAALVVHSDMQRTGWFTSSHPGLNRLHENIVWSMRDNFVDLPTDCPQRDERMGWTGDIQVFAPTALYLYGAQGVLTSWLRDVAHEQKDHGHVPNFVPWVECGFPNFPTAAWGDAAVIVPWALYQHDHDPSILASQYESMKAWVDLVDDLTGQTGLWNAGFQLGDWLDPAAPPNNPGDSHTDKYLVATAYHALSARLLARSANILGRSEDAVHYGRIAERAVAAFQNEFLSPNGRLVSDTVTSIAVALVFELFATPEQAERAGARLIELVAASDYRITTGFVGTPLVCDALTIAGGIDHAYHLLLQEELPSWLYQVGKGATTVWERWDSMLPDGSINPGGMTSFNHYALGAVADFLHRVVAGLNLPEPGSDVVVIKPHPGGGLTQAGTRHLTTHGEVGVEWTRRGTDFTIDVDVPLGLRARVTLPGSGDAFVEVGHGTHRLVGEFRSAEDDPRKPAKRRW